MKLGRFVVDTHVHAQRFAAGSALAAEGNSDPAQRSYTDLAASIRKLVAYDNSARLLFDMDAYRVDMCVLLPAFGMSNELNAAIVARHPDKFVALCSAMETGRKAVAGEEPWTAKAAAAELDRLLSTGKYAGIGEGIPSDPSRKTTLGQTERLDQIRTIMEVARRHAVPATIHTGVVMGYPLTHHYWPETLHPIWLADIAFEFRDVPIVLDHGGMQGWWSERLVEECLAVAAGNDNVYLETGLWWTELYHKALIDPNIGAEKLVWGTDWGASIPLHGQPGNHPQVYAVQTRNAGPVRHQVDLWGWSLKQLWNLNIPQDDINLILGGNAARIFKLKVPHTRLFRPVSKGLVPQPDRSLTGSHGAKEKTVEG
ncbi:MAG TPA: amidohydrolase family protein [Xanthobacteraceae bacterium]